MTNKYTDRNCSTPLAIKEIKIKTALRIHFTHVNMAVIKKITCWWGCREEIYTPLVGNQPLWESIRDSFFFFLRQLKIKPPYDRAVPFLDIYQKESEVAYHRDTSHACFCTVHSSQDTNSLTGLWTKEIWRSYTGEYSIHLKWNYIICRKTIGLEFTFSKISLTKTNTTYSHVESRFLFDLKQDLTVWSWLA